jgi:adenylate kinase
MAIVLKSKEKKRDRQRTRQRENETERDENVSMNNIICTHYYATAVVAVVSILS